MNNSVINEADKYVKKIPIVLSVIGIFGDSMVFYIMTRPKFLKESIFRYFIVSEIFSSFQLVLSWFYTLRHIPLLSSFFFNTYLCKIFIYFLFTCYQCYPWISVLNSIDQLLSLKYSY